MEQTLFSARSQMSDKEYTVFQEYSARKTIVPIAIICSLIFVVLGVVYVFDDLITGIVFMATGVLFPFIYLAFYRREVNKKKYKSNLIGNDVINFIEFKEDCFSEKTFRNGEQVGFTLLKYSDLVKIVNYKNYLFIFISKVQAFIVDKNEFRQGTAQEFLTFATQKGITIK